MDNLIVILIIIIILLIISCLLKRENFSLSDIKNLLFDDNEINLTNNEDIDDIKDFNIYEENNEFMNKKYRLNKNNDETYFEPLKFHPDYIDVINFINDNYNNISPHDKMENKIFNNNDLPTITNTMPNIKEINKVGSILNNYVKYLNKECKNDKYSINQNKWENRIEQNYKDGFQRVQEFLGLPKSLYNKSVSQTELILDEYYGLKSEKVIDTDEIEYSVYLLLSRKQTRDKILLKIKFIINDKKVMIDDIDIIGFDNNRQINPNYKDINNYYKFDSLGKSNLISVGDIFDEMKNKYAIRESVMQQSIDNLHPEDKFMHMRINPYNYNGIRTTRTIYDDINDKPLWESERA